MRRIAVIGAFVLAACGGGSSVTAPPVVVPKDTSSSFAGFDIGGYPGDNAVQAWKYPASPYRWMGYYLTTACHTDARFAPFTGKRAYLASLGWGIAALYVGQQDWANTSIAPGALGSRAAEMMAVCASSLLSADQGTAEAKDAVAKMQADGFPDGSTVFLDVEHVNVISAALLEYYRAWVAGVLADGHYKPGVYAHKANAPTFYDQAITDLHGTRYTPPFWIASWSGFSLTSKPADVGLSFAQLWQGQGGVTQTWNGIQLNIDADVSTKASPSAP